LSPPVRSATTLQANDVVLKDKKVYVAYNVAGPIQMGAIQVVDVTNQERPSLLSELVFADSKINGLAVGINSIYAVGSTSSGAYGPAVVYKIGLNETTGILGNIVANSTIPSFAGTSITLGNTYLYTTSGDTGGLNIFNLSDLSPIGSAPISDARAVKLSKDGNSVHVMSGQSGTMRKFSTTGTLQSTLSLGGANIPESKSTVDIGKTMGLVSLGESGFKVYCLANGSALAEIPQVVASGLNSLVTVTNAAASTSGLIFTANGEAGVYVYSFKDKANGNQCKNVQVNLLGAISFGNKISANSLYFQDQYLFVADGLGGLKIIALDSTKKNNGNGSLSDDSDDIDDFTDK
jgi:hypothetical protein